jgi:branched-chain amino acid transport system ATP-binding protein
MILVPLFDLKFLYELAATAVGTSNRRHRAGAKEMADAILVISGLAKRFGGLQVNSEITLDVMRNEIHALIGPNGAGKTTLINQLQGTLRPDAGHIIFERHDITTESVHARALRGIARSFQITSVIPSFSSCQNVALAVQGRLGHSFRFWKPACRDPALLQPAVAALALVGLEGRAEVPADQLSHGERRQLEIAMALAMNPKLLLLDEPMAGMGRSEAATVIRLLKRLKGRYTIVMIEHDMDAVFSLADRISVLVGGRLVATGAPQDVRTDRKVLLAYLGTKK